MLNQRQDNFLKALLETASIEEACRKAKINKNTGYKYLKDEMFIKKYRTIRRDMMQQVTSNLQKSAEDAVNTLNEIMTDKDATSGARVQAAKNVLDTAYRAIEIDDTQERLEQLERATGIENGI